MQSQDQPLSIAGDPKSAPKESTEGRLCIFQMNFMYRLKYLTMTEFQNQALELNTKTNLNIRLAVHNAININIVKY